VSGSITKGERRLDRKLRGLSTLRKTGAMVPMSAISVFRPQKKKSQELKNVKEDKERPSVKEVSKTMPVVRGKRETSSQQKSSPSGGGP